MLDIKNEKYPGLSKFMELFYERWKSYMEQWEIVEENMRKVMQDFAGKMKPVRAFCVLGEHQFTYWKPLSLDEIEGIVSTGDVNRYLMEKIEDKSFVDYDMLCDEIGQSELLSCTNKAILKQCVQAMNIGLYDLTLVGMMAILDGVLSAVTKDDSTRIPRQLEQIKDKLKDLSDEEWGLLDESEITALGIYITWPKTMEELKKHSEFEKPETEPKDLNRHWIAHGRKTTIATKLDCCKMINALYGLVYLGASLHK